MLKSEFACEPPALKTLMKSNAKGEKRTIWRIELIATRTAQSVGEATYTSVTTSCEISFRHHSAVPLGREHHKEDQEDGRREKQR